MDAVNTKAWYTSKAMWASIAVIVVAAAAAAGVQLDVGAVSQELMDITAAVGGALALYGRFHATQRITK